jgi:undecaprenyl-diphosphatase
MLPDWERGLFLLIQHSHSAPVNHFMRWFSGSGPWVLVLGWLIVRLWKRLTRRDFWLLFFLAVLLMAVVDSTTSSFFKNIFKRFRPCKMEDVRPYIPDFGQGCGGRWGFFSAHAANAAALVYFLFAFIRPNWVMKTVLVLVVLLVGISRIVLGVHLPLDVLVGFAWGLLVAHAWRYLARACLTGPIAL